jgi:hypothetical protein
MITAQHRFWAHTLFRPYLRWLCKRRFDAVEVLGELPDLPPHLPILLLPNHATWWDGFFPYLLNDVVLRRRYYIMMLEHRLREFWFFRFLGAFSINQQSPKGIITTLDYTSSLLALQENISTSPPCVVMFPQGELRAWNKRPLGYTRGIERLLGKITTPCIVLPLAMRVELLSEEKPFVGLMFGKPHIYTPSANSTASSTVSAFTLECDMEILLDELAKRIISGERGRSIV